MANYFFCLLLLFAATAQALTDPTMPPDWDAKSLMAEIPKDIIFTGVFTKKDRAFAIINGKTIHVGDMIANHEVTRIGPHAVYLKSDHGTFMVPLITKVTTPVTDEKH
ncbi:MAG: hypothetical protein ACD_42C00342G0005 [uncultured bacterium]|nr:MAG: hypothetical protein ACD_42C00342G0005 [uncultured bacterium]OGT27069.1 MAG: hypothetical protein A3B71_02310 [Gammaproteobacteria bacterium RIFCSPHIGHO2_02_FULL_42_43]OGT28311.1 MAG: hypothetical protein A2624_01520 [Gammaproteobacteria bacterium RIFCSPHIGHO2_01_FULL_42_8]OGT53518.1 MAG: hypothetical protein A3E54_02335 [Gammaproteobacteria bacterium RIFCSPHIGHO2_12_FULL_41_25]OGT61464.1 MAG: hypothetical protein A3I77_02470 [Gammaproteobacteria bacterium RIFCSPLOWO2_02_FULL_42_14]OGT